MSQKSVDKVSIFLAELLGTAMLMFFGCMGGISWDGNKVGGLQSSLAFGLVVMLIIQTFGCVSGAHLNPVVTLAAIIYDMLSVQMGIVYCVAQLLGAYLGYGLLMVVTPEEIFRPLGYDGPALCVTVPYKTLGPWQALAMEYLSTSVLIFICGGVWDPRNSKYQDSIPLKFGFAITAIGTIVGPYTGASMNPTRSLAPALWNSQWNMHWIYWAGPLPAGIIAAIIYKIVFKREVEECTSKVADIDRKLNELDSIPLKTKPQVIITVANEGQTNHM